MHRLLAGESIALVSDAGTPAISDPGQALVAAARDAGVRVESIPGPSAVMAAISASGLQATEFLFLGFPPNRLNDLNKWLSDAVTEARLVVFFEAPHRIRRTLEALAALTGPERVIAIARELTKAHEELVIKPISVVLAQLSSTRGEFTVLLPAVQEPTTTVKTPMDVGLMRVELGRITEHRGVKRRDALKTLSHRHGIPVNELYRLLQKP